VAIALPPVPVIRPRRTYSASGLLVSYRSSFVVSFRRQSVCPLVMSVYCGTTADSIEMPFGRGDEADGHKKRCIRRTSCTRQQKHEIASRSY